jgi:bacillithiol system protein YtxJ
VNWLPLESLDSLDEVIQQSSDNSLQAIIIFKHSTRCSISAMVKSRFEREWVDNPEAPVYYLDLIKHRDISNTIADKLSVKHESPQVLVIKNGECVYHASHNAISAGEVLTKL